MISKSGQSVKLPRDFKAIQFLHEIRLPDQHLAINYFIISSINRYVMLLAIDNLCTPLKPKHCVLQLNDIATSIYYDHSNTVLLIGMLGGGVAKIQADVFNVKLSGLVYQDVVWDQKRTVILVYLRRNYIFSWNLEREVHSINIKTLKTQKIVQLKQEITCSTWFLSPQNNLPIACISFLDNKPPILFQSNTLSELNTIQKLSSSLHIQNFQQHNSQIVSMTCQTTQNQQTFIICGSVTKYKNYIMVYKVEYDDKKQIMFAQTLVKFTIDHYVHNVSCQFGIIMVCTYNTIVFIHLATRKKLLKIQVPDLNVRWGIILRRISDRVNFVAVQGFNQYSPEMYKSEKIKISFRDFALDKQ